MIIVLWEPVDSGAVSTFLLLFINDKFSCYSVIECLHSFCKNIPDKHHHLIEAQTESQ